MVEAVAMGVQIKMKYLFIALTFFISFQLFGSENQCITDLKKDYEAFYGQDIDHDFLVVELKLNESLTLNLMTAKLSCGAKGCDYIGYFKDSPDCFRRVIDFHGSFELGNAESNGIKSILIHQPIKGNDEKICLWSYKIYLDKFERIIESCQVKTKN